MPEGNIYIYIYIIKMWLIVVLTYALIITLSVVGEIAYQNSATVLLTITYWMLILQAVYYYLEYRKVDDKTIETFLNYIFAPSASVLCYWLVGSAMEWDIMSSMWFLDIFTHGINVFALALIVILRRPCIRWNFWYPYAIPIFYLCVTFTYTALTKTLIYPDNFFSFSHIEDKQSYAWVGIILLIVPNGLAHVLFYYISEYMSGVYKRCPREDIG
jgi:hypothetical protein